MLAQIYNINGEYHLFLNSGTHEKLHLSQLRSFLESFDSDEYYASEDANIFGLLTPACGELVAQVSDDKELIILSSTFVRFILGMDEPQYLTADEYAEKVGRTKNMIGKMCREGRIPGAIQKGSRWLIPEDAPYPSSNR